MVKYNNKNNNGFTLVEMLVVIAIIGIISVIGLVSLEGARASARNASRMSDLAQLRLGLALYSDDHDQYPAPVTASGAGPDSSILASDGTIFSDNGNPLFPGYLSRTMSDPLNNQTSGYYYTYDTNENIGHRGYVLCFQEEGQTGIWFYFYSTGIYGKGDHCPTLPGT
ncbi:prepilin-type N-terminal cleavage/methylation domain-containing protein [Patescibacteria group bacterium]|nr:prepilin-type N-terminal cleavage/methylation domain-containing protein [Patescibacteria group bacterium]MBU0964478.1 prepilin-type N-terminal cleavage/methylation domain-containing protein [Patescibacteria group bacterium]